MFIDATNYPNVTIRESSELPCTKDIFIEHISGRKMLIVTCETVTGLQLKIYEITGHFHFQTRFVYRQEDIVLQHFDYWYQKCESILTKIRNIKEYNRRQYVVYNDFMESLNSLNPDVIQMIQTYYPCPEIKYVLHPFQLLIDDGKNVYSI